MRYLTDDEIHSWNKRISNSPYMVHPKYNKNSGYPDICFVQKVSNWNSYSNSMGSDSVQTNDPFIEFEYVFSVSSARNDEFFSIFSLLLKEGILTKVSTGKDDRIDISDPSSMSHTTQTHTLSNVEFTRYHYVFKSKLSSIIGYITTLEDAVKFLEMLWGYDEDGKEISLLKYKIGSVVSIVEDRSSDFMVIDYVYSRQTVGRFRIMYRICEILISDKSPVVKYGDVRLFSEDLLCFSRNDRIDDILN